VIRDTLGISIPVPWEGNIVALCLLQEVHFERTCVLGSWVSRTFLAISNHGVSILFRDFLIITRRNDFGLELFHDFGNDLSEGSANKFRGLCARASTRSSSRNVGPFQWILLLVTTTRRIVAASSPDSIFWFLSTFETIIIKLERQKSVY
jgi:hypothetical protein